MLKAGLFSLMVAVACLSSCATKPYVATDYEASYNFAALKSFVVKSAKQDTKENILIGLEQNLESNTPKQGYFITTETLKKLIFSFRC